MLEQLLTIEAALLAALVIFSVLLIRSIFIWIPKRMYWLAGLCLIAIPDTFNLINGII